MQHLTRVTLFSFFTGFIIILIQLFTREVTLDGVRGIDFELVYKFVDKKEAYEPSHIKDALSSLRNKDTVLFPMAVLTTKECIDNSLEHSKKQICNLIQNIQNFEIYLQKQKQKTLIIDGKNYVNHSSRFFIYKKFQNIDGYLIGHAGKYVFSDDLEITKFFYFLENEFLNLFTSKKGREKLWLKSKDMFFTLVFLSFSLGFLYLRRVKISLKRYKNLLHQQQQEKKEWNNALEEQQKIQKFLDVQEEEIAIKEAQLEEFAKSSKEDSELLQEISTLKSSKEEMLDKLKNSSQSITILEAKEASLIQTILQQSKRLASSDNSAINDDTYKELVSIKKLWRIEPKWRERSIIETEVATNEGRTPFTITQAFITFDAYVLSRATRKGYNANEKDDLYNAINFLQDNKLLRAGEKGMFHKIRKSRNDWFHHAKYPNETIIKKLLDILEFQNQKPLL